MYDALHREAWDKGSTDITYVTIEHPNLLNNPLITQPGEVVWLLMRMRNSSQYMETLTTVAQYDTTEPRRP